MRLSPWLIICLLCLQFPTYSHGYGQDDRRITISGTFTLHAIFQKIEEQTGKRVYYTNTILNDEEKATINVKRSTIDQLLTQLFVNKHLEWSIEQKFISIRRPKTSSEASTPTKDSTISITGRVVNKTGDPIAGATILIKGEQLGSATLADGTFTIKNVSPNSSILISNVGYLTKEFFVKGKSSIGVISLEEYVSVLDETQVIAYGETSKRLNPGNVTIVKSDVIEKQPVNNFLHALQGRVAGVTITPTSGIAGSPVTVQIRGRNSLNIFAGNDPLYVIDGLPLTSTLPAITTGAGAPLGNGISPFNYINPNDISSISVLKDADATSVYGSRGANGVILITTKRGKAGSANIDINVQKGISQVPKKLDMMNTEQYISMRKEALSNDGRIDRLNNPSFAGTYADLMLWDQTKYTDWQEEIIGRNGQFLDVQSSVSGGNEFISYRVGGNFHRETTVFPGNNADNKGSGNMTLSGTSANKKLKVTVSAFYLANKSNIPKVDFTNIALTTEPNAPDVYNSDGTVNWAIYPQTGENSTRLESPYSAQLLSQYILNINNLSATSSISYNFGRLELLTTLGFNELRGNSLQKTPIVSFQPSLANISSLRSTEFNDNRVKNVSVEPQLKYQTNLFQGNLTVLLGGSFQSTIQNSNFLTLNDYLNDALLGSKDAAATVRTKSNTSSEYKYCALFARLNYLFQNKYIINITARRDGSSRFGPDNRFGSFGSVGLGWIFSKEDFLSKLKFLSYGKLRISYGTSGNDGIGDYQYLEQYQRTSGNPYQGAVGYQSTGLFNTYYHWQTTKKAEIGLETGFMNDRIFISTSYFRDRSNNQLLSYPTPSISGPGSLITNLPALIQNSGLEIETNTTNVQQNNFRWTTSINFSIIRNKLLKYPNINNSAYSQANIGEPFWGWRDVYKSAGVNPETGLYQFMDLDGKIVENPATATEPKYGRDIRINLAPVFQGGIGNTITIKNFQLDFFFQFIKQNGINPLYQITAYPGQSRSNQLSYIYGKQFKKPGDNAEFMKFSTTGKGQSIGFIRESDRGYVDASFIRLKNVSFTYNIPTQLQTKMRMRNMRLYIQGQNLLTFTKYKGFDPESQSLAVLPPLRTITVGIQVGL